MLKIKGNLRISAVALLWAMIVITGACSSNVEDTSRLSHDLNKPTRYPSKWQWHEVNEKEFQEVMAPYVDPNLLRGHGRVRINGKPVRPSQVPEILALDHPLSVWLTAMAGYLVTRQKQLEPVLMENAPMPVVRVVNDNRVNLLYHAVPVCLRLPVQFDPDHEMLSGGDEVQVSFTDDGKLTERWLPQNHDCAKKGLSWEEAKDFVKFVNDLLVQDKQCSYSLGGEESNFWMIPGDKCDVDGIVDPEQKPMATEIVYSPQSNVITVHIQSLTLFDFKEVFFLLAHELGHMLRTHVLIPPESGVFGFFYPLARRNSEGKPVPDDSEEIKRISEAVKNVKLQNHYRSVEGQKFSSQIFRLLKGVGKEVANQLNQDLDDSAAKAPVSVKCIEFNDWLGSEEVEVGLGGFPLEKLSDDGVKIYFEFEKRIEECLKTVSIGTSEEDVKSEVVISPEDFSNAVSDSVFYYDRYVLYREDGTTPAFESKGKAVDALKEVEELFNDAKEAANNTLREAADIHLGYYTRELEADEVATEILADAGLDPEMGIDNMVEAVKFLDQEYDDAGVEAIPFSLNFEKCKELYENDWMDDGRYYYVPVAIFQGFYPQRCYRAFNMSREIEVHGFTSGDSFDFTPPTKHKWAELMEMIPKL